MPLTAPLRRPLGPLKSAIRQYRRQRLCERCLATRAQASFASAANDTFVVPPYKPTKSPYRILNETVHKSKLQTTNTLFPYSFHCWLQRCPLHLHRCPPSLRPQANPYNPFSFPRATHEIHPISSLHRAKVSLSPPRLAGHAPPHTRPNLSPHPPVRKGQSRQPKTGGHSPHDVQVG